MSPSVTATMADALVPIFAGLLLGYLAGRWHAMDNENVNTLNTFVTSFAIPCSIFLVVASTPLRDLREQGAAALVLAIMFVALFASVYFWARSQQKFNPADSSVLALSIGFPNSAAVGVSLLTSVFGSRSAVTVATSIAIGSITVSPLTLVILEASRSSSPGGFAWGNIASALLRTVSKPIVWAPVLGFAFSCAGLNVPDFASRSLGMIAAAADGSALVLTGLVVSAQAFEVRGSTLAILALKFLVQPVLGLAAARLVGLSLEQTQYVTLIGAIPCGFFGVVFGKSFGSNPKLASTGLIASYIASVATFPAWIAVVRHLG